MRRQEDFRKLWVAPITILIAAAIGQAQEHPEHPKSKTSSRQASPSVALADVAAAIEAYVEWDRNLKGGYFLLYDGENQEALVLTLERVHRDRLSSLGEGEYFACADFVTADGRTYDLDFIVHGPDTADLEVAEIMVHKEEGTPRYTWYEDDGIWRRKATKEDERSTRAESANPRSSARYEITVDEAGFHPSSLTLQVGVPAMLVLTRTTDRTCAKEVVFPSLDTRKKLPLNQPVEIVVKPTRRGEIRFACGMDMMTGVIHVE